MKQVIQNRRSGKLALKEVPDPIVKSGHILVRTKASLISAGTERMLIDFSKKSLVQKAKARPDLTKKVLNKIKKDGILSTLKTVMVQLDKPLPLGYSAVGEIIGLGDGVEGFFKIGERVAIAGAGIANHAEINVVPISLAALVPQDVKDEEACFGTLGAIALHAIRNLNVGLGETIAIIGMGLVGQLAAQFLALSGTKVVALDYDQTRLDLAKKIGADHQFNLSIKETSNQVLRLTKGRGCDAILIAAATDSNEPFEIAAKIARDRAKISLVGMTGTAFPYAEFMKKELNIVVSRSYGPGRYDEEFEYEGIKYPEGWVRWTETENLKECIRLMQSKNKHRLEILPLISHRLSFNEAEQAYAMILDRSQRQMGVVLSYPEQYLNKLTPLISTQSVKSNRPCILGVIGGGDFAKTVLMPELKNNRDVQLQTIANSNGANANQNLETFGFKHATTDPKIILQDPLINAVVIATRHNTHADLTTHALNAGKCVFVEKPLALTAKEINQIIKAKNKFPNTFFQVGFNRRFAPMALKIQSQLSKELSPKFINIRVNAGALPPNHWVHKPNEGGGRILGEVCHFVDLARFFANSPITSIYGEASNGNTLTCDNVIVSLTFANDSLATILYTAHGDMNEGKEYYEIFSAGKNFKLNDFRELEITKPKKIFEKKRTQDKGHRSSINAFISAVKNHGPAPINQTELIETTSSTISILTSIKSGKRITL